MNTAQEAGRIVDIIKIIWTAILVLFIINVTSDQIQLESSQVQKTAFQDRALVQFYLNIKKNDNSICVHTF